MTRPKDKAEISPEEKKVEDTALATSDAANLSASLWPPHAKILGINLKKNIANDSEYAWVKLKYDRKTGDLTAKDVDTGDSLTIKAFSGNGKFGVGYEGGEGADGRYDDQPDVGPIPSGKYLVGESHAHAGPPGGDNNWYALFGSDGKGHYSNAKIDDHNGGFRSGIFLHTGSISDGCLTVKSDVETDAPNYPHSAKFDKLHELLDNTKLLKYKRSRYVGKLEVK